jgi:hypothetical protein
MDFCNQSNSYMLKYDLRPAGDAQYDNDAAEAVCASPDVGHLRVLMRQAYSHQTDLKKKSEEAFATASNYTWAHAAETIERILAKLREEV